MVGWEIIHQEWSNNIFVQYNVPTHILPIMLRVPQSKTEPRRQG